MSLDYFVVAFILAIMIAAIGIRQELIYREEAAFRKWFYTHINFMENGDDDE